MQEPRCSCGMGECPMHDPPELGQVMARLRGPRSVPRDIIDKGTTWSGFLAALKAERARRVNVENYPYSRG